MDGSADFTDCSGLKRICARADDIGDLAEKLRFALADRTWSLLLAFASPVADLEALGPVLTDAAKGAAVIGCTTAGEISNRGYDEGSIVVIAFCADEFTAAIRSIDDLDAYRISDGPEIVRDLVTRAARPELANAFAIMLADGLSKMEDVLVASFGPTLGGIELFGGSAGDGGAFRRTLVCVDGVFRPNAAAVALVRTRRPVRVFRFDHFLPTDRRMVVTDADPEQRIVRGINAEPAAREYARLVGRDGEALTNHIFASAPVVVRLGDEHHVRAIQKVEANGDLRFYSSIEEGLVFSVAEGRDIVSHLELSLCELGIPRAPDLIIGCDCMLRRIEVDQRGVKAEMSDILRRHGVVGFNTYGEQFNMLHVNQTLTGVAIYPMEETRAGDTAP